MANLRENVEFFYGLAVVISIVVVFFRLYPVWGLTMEIGVTVAVGVVEAVIGFVAFESEEAIERWNRMSKKQPEATATC